MKSLFFNGLLLALVFITGARSAEAVSEAKPLLAELQAAEHSQIRVLEGLPHPMFERDVFEAEKKREDVKEVGGYFFYTPDLPVEEKAAAVFQKLAEIPGLLEEFSGEKKCGGFHPDYALIWPGKSGEVSALICFNCGEILILSGDQTLRYDLGKDGLDVFKAVLQPFQAKRPDTERR